jgi:pyruvate/2-oxoglutarate dehydrogenase complex dihydrolipoamide acyltransferase (E2) component
MNTNTYPHPRPAPPAQLYLLAALSVFGLAALWLAAFHAFSQVAGGPQAFFAATLIEAGLIVEALALVKRPKVWYIWIAILISLVVSGTYNYIQAAAAAPAFNVWQLGTLALGPLAALAFVSLTLGYELREFQQRVEKWQTDRAAWLEQRQQEAETYERQKEANRQAWLRGLQEAEQRWQREAAERQWQAEQAEREWQRKRQERAERRAERQERTSEPAPAAQTAARAAPEPDPSQLQCPGCPRAFGTQAALNAHRRFCPGSIRAKSQPEPALAAVLNANGKGTSILEI